MFANRLLLLIVTFLSALQLSLAACKHPIQHPTLTNPTLTTLFIAGTSFCKCTCFTNSTIIQLNTKHDTDSKTDAPKTAHGTCADCNRAFCLDYNLPICKGAKEEDVFTTCFQRDSAKDEAVVFIFISATVGLLVWAGVRGWVGKWREKRAGQYFPVRDGEGE